MMISGYSLGATHLAVFVHISLAPIVSNVKADCLATGIQNMIGNKGGISISFNLGKSSMIFVSCHLAAGQNDSDRRNLDFSKIYRKLVLC